MNNPPCILGVFAAAALAGVAGCAVDQAKEVATYRRVLDAQAPATVPPLGAGEALTLQRAVELANQYDEQLSLRGETYLQSLIERARAAAGFLPTVGISASSSVSHSQGGGAASSTRYATSVPVQGSISVFNLRTFANVDRAGAAAEQQRRLLLDLQQTVLIGVAQNFYQVLRLERSVLVFKNTLALKSEQVRDMRARSNLGMNKPLDLAQAEADESTTRVALLQATSDVRNARTTLAFLTGMPEIDSPLDDRFTPAPAQLSEADFEAAALEHRQDLLAARAAIESDIYNVKSAYRQYYPAANLNLNYLLFRHPDAGGLWSAAVSVAMPLYSAGLIHEDVRAALSGLRQARLSEARLQRQIHQDVQIAYEDFATSGLKIAELKTTVEAAQRAFDLAAASYRLGSATNLDQLSAQDTLLSVQLQSLTERYNQKVFYLNLLRVTGELELSTPAQLEATGPVPAAEEPLTTPSTNPIPPGPNAAPNPGQAAPAMPAPLRHKRSLPRARQDLQ